jgi:cathepsin A (carboxypeptidase C)
MASNLPRCLEVAKVCYDSPDPAICQAAASVCWEGVIKWYDSESYKGGRNRFDITAPCDIDDFCYANTGLIQDYLNLPDVFSALGVPSAVKKFLVGGPDVSEAFEKTNDLAISLIPEVQYLLASQIDILIYQGNLDLACNTAGAKRWTSNMAWKGQAEFVGKDLKDWQTEVEGKKKTVGKFKEVKVRMVEGSEKKTRFTLLTIDGSGHMVPQDQPEVAVNMLGKWIKGEAFD